MKSSFKRWKTLPGSFDTTKAFRPYPSDNLYDIPSLKPFPIKRKPLWLAPHTARLRTQNSHEGAIHFFLDDYRFESVWTYVDRTTEKLKRRQIATLTPDFSLYIGMGISQQIYNVFRNRWCGAHWQEQGIDVIPSVSWSTPNSYDFCFLGIPQRSIIAVSTVGIRRGVTQSSFLHGFDAMIEHLSPPLVLCYGKPLPQMSQKVSLEVYPDHWESVHTARYEAHSGRRAWVAEEHQ